MPFSNNKPPMNLPMNYPSTSIMYLINHVRESVCSSKVKCTPGCFGYALITLFKKGFKGSSPSINVGTKAVHGEPRSGNCNFRNREVA